MYGFTGTTIVDIDWIDNVVPTIAYSPNSLTSGNVTATISFDRTGVYVTNTGGSIEHVFTGNGSFIFEFFDSVA
jgi:hypothetical protein